MSNAKNQPSSPTHTAAFPRTPATHQEAKDVGTELRNSARIGLGNTPHQYLANFAKLAIERLDADNDLRTESMLDALLQGYARTYGELVDLETCAAAHRICARRFWDYEPDVLAGQFPTAGGVLQ